MNKLSTIQKALIKIAGYDLTTAKHCSSPEVNSMVRNGTLILIPGLVGVFSMGYAIHLLSGSMLTSIIGGLTWCVVIILIDRAVVSQSRPGKFGMGLIGRLILAATIGFILAEPIVLFAFNDSVQEELKTSYLNEKDKLKNKFEAPIADLELDSDNALLRVNELQRAYQQEMDGTGGSGVANKGPIFRQKYTDWENENKRYLALKAENDSVINALNLEYTNELAVIETNQAQGLLGRFRALHRIEDKEVEYATWLLRVFFFMIELIPFLIKITPTDGTDEYFDLSEDTKQKRLLISTSESTLKNQVLLEEEKLLNQQKILALKKKEIELLSAGHVDNMEYHMKLALASAERKIGFDVKVIRKIKDEKIRAELLEKFNDLYDQYLESLAILSSNPEPNKINS